MSSILIIEDEPNIRDSLQYGLKARGYETMVAANGRVGLDMALSGQPDLVLLDLLLPEKDGIEVCRELRQQDKAVRIIMISALGTDSDKIKGLTVGADDYVTKPFNFEELLARVQAQLRRQTDPPARASETLQFGDIEIDRSNYDLTVGGQTVRLRPKEFKLLLTLAEEPGLLFSRQTLSDRVWGSDFVGSSRTIDVHVQRIREKVEKLSAYKLIRTVHGLGYRFEIEPKISTDAQ